MSKQAKLEACVANIVEAAGCELVGIERVYQGQKPTLRIYLDKKPGGVTIGECAQLSRRIHTMLQVESPVEAEMTLEVSSPGLDRRIFNIEQARAFIGRELDVSLSVSVEGRRHIVAFLKGVTDNTLQLATAVASWDIPFDDISVARLVPNV